MQEIVKVNEIIEINPKVRGFCKFQYHGHKHGCPNFNNHILCPPKIKTVDNYFDINKDLFFIITEFDFKSYIENTRIKHPNWSLLQLKNPLYWQNGVRKTLKNKVENFINIHVDKHKLTYTLLPEAMGIDVFSTVIKIGIPIERNPINKIFKIALVGYSINDEYHKLMKIKHITNENFKTKSLLDY